MDGLDKGRRIVAALALLALVAVVVALSFSDRTAKPMAINGDTLGPDSTESSVEYQERAAVTFAEAPLGETAYSLITFTQPLGSEDAASLLQGVKRVNAMIMLSAPAMDIPEPIAGETRADVFKRQISLVDASLAGIGDVRAPTELNGVVVWEAPENLEKIAENPLVFSVETLPPDAAWGSFGVRPVNLQ